MRLAALFSGGKDSTYTIHQAREAGHDVRYLISFVSENPDSYMFHHPNIELTQLLAESMGIELLLIHTKGEKEKELLDIQKALKMVRDDIDGVAAGALASHYQYDRVKAICDTLHLGTFTPSWQRSMDNYWEELLAHGFKIIITRVACDGLTQEWLGREITPSSLQKLKSLSSKFHFHLGGEGGEFETLVLDCPLYHKGLKILHANKIWSEDTGVYNILKAELVDKHG